MRVALIVPGFSRGADDWAIPALQQLALRLAAEHDLEVFSLRYPPAGAYHFGGLHHWAIGGGVRAGVGSAVVWRQALRTLAARHKHRPFDLIHAFWVDEPAFVAALAGWLLRLPVVASVGGGELVHFPDIGYGMQGSALRRLMIRFALRRAAVVTVGSAYLRALCRAQNVPERKLRLAPLGVELSLFESGPSPAGPPTLIQAASLVPVKQQALLLEVLARVRAERPALRLLIAGEGPLRGALAAQAAALGVGDAVRWLGKVPYAEMPAVYRRGHVYVQTSHHESQGMAVLEAMGCGVSALGTPVGVLPEVAAAPPAWDAAQLAGQVIALLAEPNAYEEQRAAARQQVEARFSLPHAASRFTRVYEGVRLSTESSLR